jgi:chemotaxis protein methyltransferase CheR
MQLDAKSFQMIADLAYRESGLQLVSEKTSMIQSRLRKRLTSLNFPDFNQYCDFVCSENGIQERRHMISALTTNVSHFFREKHHFDALREHVLRRTIAELEAGGRLRIWSAGCSNGQEALSIAMSLLESAPKIAHLDARILATDIDPEVVAFANNAMYPARMMNGVSANLIDKYFDPVSSTTETQFRAKTVLRDMITFKELNLLTDWPMKREFDVIFCRNVVIYFDKPTQNRLWPKFRSVLAADGLMFLGHSERIVDPATVGFANVGPTTYTPTKTSR